MLLTIDSLWGCWTIPFFSSSLWFTSLHNRCHQHPGLSSHDGGPYCTRQLLV